MTCRERIVSSGCDSDSSAKGELLTQLEQRVLDEADEGAVGRIGVELAAEQRPEGRLIVYVGCENG